MPGTLRKRLSYGRWFHRLQQISDRCPRAAARNQAKLIREMRELLAVAPNPALYAGLDLLDPAWLETRLRARCYETAVFDMLSPETGYMLSKGDQGRHLASVILPGATEESVAAGSTLALALIGAMASALSQGGMAAFPGDASRAQRYLH